MNHGYHVEVTKLPRRVMIAQLSIAGVEHIIINESLTQEERLEAVRRVLKSDMRGRTIYGDETICSRLAGEIR